LACELFDTRAKVLPVRRTITVQLSAGGAFVYQAEFLSTADIVGIWVTITGNALRNADWPFNILYDVASLAFTGDLSVGSNSFHAGVIIGTADGTTGIQSGWLA